MDEQGKLLLGALFYFIARQNLIKKMNILWDCY